MYYGQQAQDYVSVAKLPAVISTEWEYIPPRVTTRLWYAPAATVRTLASCSIVILLGVGMMWPHCPLMTPSEMWPYYPRDLDPQLYAWPILSTAIQWSEFNATDVIKLRETIRSGFVTFVTFATGLICGYTKYLRRLVRGRRLFWVNVFGFLPQPLVLLSVELLRMPSDPMGLGALTLWTKLSRVNHQTLLWYYCLSCAPSCSCLVCPEKILDDQQMSSVECETLNPAPYTKSAIGKQCTTTRRENSIRRCRWYK